MLPVINLDDQNFSDIFEEARKMIPGTYPGWTDYNEHDPGISFLELFSWFKEMQQYHLNQIGKDNYLMYLKLLGMQQLKKKPAQALVEVSEVTSDFDLPEGSKLYAGQISFEAMERESLNDLRITKCIAKTEENEMVIEESVLHSGSFMRLYPFGNPVHKNNTFYIMFNHPIAPNKLHSIYFKVFEDYPVRRNTVEQDFIPLADISLEYYGVGGWKQCELRKDETCQFIQSGKIYFTCREEMQLYDNNYCIRFRIEACSYEVPPILQEIVTNVIYVKQVATATEYKDYEIKREESREYKIITDSYLSLHGIPEVFLLEEKGFRNFYNFNCISWEKASVIVLDNPFDCRKEQKLTVRVVSYEEDFGFRRQYDMDGFPYQRIDLEDDEILYDSFEIFVENELYPGCFEQWKKVDNFYNSSQQDCHYILDEEKGELIFGNCENGKAPEGELIIIGYADTLGIRGNVKAKQINRLLLGEEEIMVSNRDNAYNGSDKESMDACFKRFMREFRQVRRAITDEDYETIVKNTPGLMIQNVKTIPTLMMKKRDGSLEENCVSVVVQQFTGGQRTKLSDAYLKNIGQLLDKRRLVGTKVTVLSPEYIGIGIFGEIIVKPHYINARDIIKTAVEEYFFESGSSFGKPVLYNEIYGIIDVLDCVLRVQNLSINSQGRGITRSMNGDLLLPVNGLVYLKEADYFITSAE